MAMQKCKQCSKKFRWEEIFISFFRLNVLSAPIVCDNCKTSHCMTFYSRLFLDGSGLVSLFIVRYLYSFLQIYTVIVFFAWIFIIFLLSPYFLKM